MIDTGLFYPDSPASNETETVGSEINELQREGIKRVLQFLEREKREFGSAREFLQSERFLEALEIWLPSKDNLEFQFYEFIVDLQTGHYPDDKLLRYYNKLKDINLKESRELRKILFSSENLKNVSEDEIFQEIDTMLTIAKRKCENEKKIKKIDAAEGSLFKESELRVEEDLQKINERYCEFQGHTGEEKHSKACLLRDLEEEKMYFSDPDKASGEEFLTEVGIHDLFDDSEEIELINFIGALEGYYVFSVKIAGKRDLVTVLSTSNGEALKLNDGSIVLDESSIINQGALNVLLDLDPHTDIMQFFSLDDGKLLLKGEGLKVLNIGGKLYVSESTGNTLEDYNIIGCSFIQDLGKDLFFIKEKDNDNEGRLFLYNSESNEVVHTFHKKAKIISQEEEVSEGDRPTIIKKDGDEDREYLQYKLNERVVKLYIDNGEEVEVSNGVEQGIKNLAQIFGRNLPKYESMDNFVLFALPNILDDLGIKMEVLIESGRNSGYISSRVWKRLTKRIGKYSFGGNKEIGKRFMDIESYKQNLYSSVKKMWLLQRIESGKFFSVDGINIIDGKEYISNLSNHYEILEQGIGEYFIVKDIKTGLKRLVLISEEGVIDTKSFVDLGEGFFSSDEKKILVIRESNGAKEFRANIFFLDEENQNAYIEVKESGKFMAINLSNKYHAILSEEGVVFNNNIIDSQWDN